MAKDFVRVFFLHFFRARARPKLNHDENGPSRFAPFFPVSSQVSFSSFFFCQGFLLGRNNKPEPLARGGSCTTVVWLGQ